MFILNNNFVFPSFFVLVFGVKDSKPKDVEWSVFPPGPFVLPMSSDGCPEGPDQGWHVSYINITTRIPFDQSETFLHYCGKHYGETSFNVDLNANAFDLTQDILLTFDDYTLKWNFCFKSNDHQNKNKLSWPLGIYGLYGTTEGCPEGFTAHNMTSCLPPILRHNSDGYVPFYTVEETQDSAVFTFLYCRRSWDENEVTSDFRSFYPFFLIKDPRSIGCAVMTGYEVTEEVFPGPVYSVISDSDKLFALTYCYYVNKTFEHTVYTYNFRDVWESEGFNATGTAFVDSQNIFPLENSLLGLSEGTERWVLIDARETRLVSAILFLTFGLDVPAILHNDTEASVSHIYVGDERWSFLNGGALQCRFSVFKSSKEWTWYTRSDQEIYSCYRSEYGRYLTMVFSSNVALGDNRMYNETCILVLTNDEEAVDIHNCNEELGMSNYDIKDSQLTSSTWQASFPPTHARHPLSGWCAEYGDTRPFIQVDLEHVTTVNGVILTNWYGVTDTVVGNAQLKFLTLKGSHSFRLEFGTSLNDMKVYNQKEWSVDRSQDLEIPQTFLLSEPVTARYIRLYPTPFENTSAPCIKFELLGCRMTEKESLENYGTKVDQDWAIYFDVPYIPINHPQVINNFGYPTTYTQNTFYKWNITFTAGSAFLQFVDISLRVYEKADSQNNMGCRDTIIVSGFDIVNPLTYIKEYFIYVNEHIPTHIGIDKIRVLLTSDDNGRLVGVPQADKEGTPLYLGLLSCSTGKMVEQGRGFRVHVVRSELPVCWSEDPENTMCATASMELISPRFLGMYDSSERYRYSFWPFTAHGHEVIIIKFTDFDISCYADSSLGIYAEPEMVYYCNKNVVYEEQSFMTATFHIDYAKFTHKTCEVPVFPEGFRLIYRMVPDIVSTPTYVRNGSDGLIEKQVCSGEFQKCYNLQFIFTGKSWMDSAHLCRKSQTRLVTIKSAKELSYIRQLIVDMYDENYDTIDGYIYQYNHVVESFIGLQRYVDTTGVHHEHWIDGSPLTFTSWDAKEPSDTLLKQCTKMWLTAGKLEKETTWQTVTCDRKLETTLHICEQRQDDPQRKQTVQLRDCFQSSASQYKGNVSVTRHGNPCQRWDSQSQYTHAFIDQAGFPDPTVSDASNYCRSPDNDHTPWCFTMDSMIAWDYCEVNMCTSDVDLPPPKDPVTLFRCNSGEWMSRTVKCNGVPECLDKTDEANCSIGDTKCKDDEFTCTDGRCIHVFQICDFNADCDDASDEFCDFPACDGETEYRCDSGQCIAHEDRCDSVKQCADGSDEQFCEKCNADRACQCGDRTCISKRLICDLHTDCLDGADEDSCEHIYTSCDDVWLDGLTEDGIYPIGEDGVRTKCMFNRSSGFLFMEFLNTDWRRLGEGHFLIEIPDLSILAGPTAHGYQCSQQFDEVDHRERQNVKMIENTTLKVSEQTYTMNNMKGAEEPEQSNFTVSPSMLLYVKDGFNSVDNRIYIHNMKCKKGLGLWENTTFCEKGWKSSKQRRWCEFGIDKWFYIPSCHPWEGCGLNRWNDNIFCSKGKSIESSKRCMYDLDENGITDGCRSLNHLQKCENMPCPADHFKCPESYCVPLMYVCNGRIDCPGGQDEKYCECKTTDQKDIYVIVPSSDFLPFARASLLFETATRLGGTLYSEYSKIRIVKQSISPDLDEGPYVFDSASIEGYSEHPSQKFDRFFLSNTNDPFDGTSQKETSIIIWLSDTLDATENENYIFTTLDNSNRSGPLLKYRVVIGLHAQEAVSISNEVDVKQLLIRDYNVLGTLGGASLFPDICTGQPVHCANRYRCSLSMVCIPHDQVCDGKPHCPFSDDEELCTFTCPAKCSCKPFIVNCANIDVNVLRGQIPETTRILDASNTTELGVDILTRPDRYAFPLLVTLNISRCGITELTELSFQYFINLLKLDISFNEFTKLPRDMFVNLHLLQELHLSGNRMLSVIEPGAFHGLQIDSLSIKDANLERLYARTFAGLTLKVLLLSSNKIKRVDDLTFSSLMSKEINIEDNPLTDFSKKMFDGVAGVENLYTSAYKFCCVRPAYLNEESCLPYKDEFSSCKHLLRNTTLQALMWTVGFLALIGNVLSIVYRLIYDKKRLKIGYGIFVTNLAVSDLLMGIYMLIIAVADKVFMDRYIEVDEYWRNSAWCKLAGVLSTLSSEASVLFMCLITIDRVLVIKFPFGEYRVTTFTAMVSVMLAWALSFLIALLPVMYENYFQNKFYSKSGVCLALPLTRDRPPGWLYAILIFVGFNLITFTLIAGGQLLIYTEVRKQSLTKKRMNATRSNDLKVARNLLLLVSTDFMCWFPVGLMGILAMAGYVIPGEMYAWTAVLILPINSALNPFMYTFSAIISAKKFSPNIQEQTSTDDSEENGKLILDVLPYVVQKNGSFSNRMCSLSNVLQMKTLSTEEIVYIIHVLNSYLALLHDNGLFLDNNLDDRYIMLKISSNLQVNKSFPRMT